MSDKNFILNVDMISEYNDLLKSGMFWEFYPQLSGNYLKDEKEWSFIYNEILKQRDNVR